MSLSSQHSAAVSPVECERSAFFRILFHDDRNSFYVISSDESGVWKDVALRRSALDSYAFNSSANYYISHNGFTGKRRLSESTRQINALFFDIDCHGAQPALQRGLVSDVLARIFDAVSAGHIPNPNIVVDSGRGVHLYFVFERSIPYRLAGNVLNSKALFLVSKAQKSLAYALDAALAGLSGVTVDRAVFDHARVSRIPGTRNASAGCLSSIVSSHDAYFQLSALASFCPLPQHKRSTPRTSASLLRYNRAMMGRLVKIAGLQQHRGFRCEGTRELMCFAFYNTAVQIYERPVAQQQLRAFNEKFLAPLSSSELAGVTRAVDSVVNYRGQKGHYILKTQTLIDLLSMTDQEVKDLRFFSSKRHEERLLAKQATLAKRTRRNARIIELYRARTHTYADIAASVGCSVRTVCSVLKSEGLTRSQKPRLRQPRLHVHSNPKLTLKRALRRPFLHAQNSAKPQKSAQPQPCNFLSQMSIVVPLESRFARSHLSARSFLAFSLLRFQTSGVLRVSPSGSFRAVGLSPP